MIQQTCSRLLVPKPLKRRLQFRACKTVSILLKALLQLQQTIQSIKQQKTQEFPWLEHFNLYFYLCFDNVKSLLKLERSKKVVEKICIA